MKIIIAILAVTCCQIVGAQTITTYDSRFGVQPVASSYQAVDVGDTRSDDYKEMSALFPLRSLAVPALIDLDTRQGVTITSTIAQAEADLAALDNQRRPARKALKDYLAGRTRKQTSTELRQAINAAATVAQLRKAMKDMDEYRELVEGAEDEREQLGLKKERD